MAVNDVDKFLTGLLQYVNVHPQTICFHLPRFPPAGLIEKTVATESARFIQTVQQGFAVEAGKPP